MVFFQILREPFSKIQDLLWKFAPPILHELVTNKIKIADSCPSWKINWCSKNRTTSIFPRRPDNLAKSGYELINGNNEHQGSHQTVREVTCIREDAEGNLFFYWKWALHSALAAQTLSTGRLLRNNGSNLITRDSRDELSPLKIGSSHGVVEVGISSFSVSSVTDHQFTEIGWSTDEFAKRYMNFVSKHVDERKVFLR